MTDLISFQLGTSINVLSDLTFVKRGHPVYLVNPPYNNDKPLIDDPTIIYFISTFDNNKYSFSQTYTIKKRKKLIIKYSRISY